MDARHADGRSAAAARLGRAYTALAWGRIGDDAYLAAGTQGGDVVVWRMAHREGGPEATYTTTLRLEASVQHIGWNDARLAVCTTEAVHVLALSTTLERRAALPMRRAVSCLTWAASTLHMATPGALVCWDTTQPSATEHRVDSAYGAGTVGTAVALRTGALVGWDAQPRDPVWTPAVQPLWAVAEAAPLVATLAEADEHASWRYRVARRMSYTLYTPFDKDWDASEDQLARLYALFPSEARLPILRWRAVLLSAVQCAQQDVVLDKLCVRLDEEKVRPLAAACASLLESEADTYAAWASPAAEAQSARWCSAWASARSGARHAVADAASWLAERVVALASAAAALGAGDRGAHVERLAARLLLLAQDAPDSQPSFSSFLVQIARRLHPLSEKWAMDDLHLGEVCAACSSPIPFSLAQYAQCTAGHVFGTSTRSPRTLRRDRRDFARDRHADVCRLRPPSAAHGPGVGPRPLPQPGRVQCVWKSVAVTVIRKSVYKATTPGMGDYVLALRVVDFDPKPKRDSFSLRFFFFSPACATRRSSSRRSSSDSSGTTCL